MMMMIIIIIIIIINYILQLIYKPFFTEIFDNLQNAPNNSLKSKQQRKVETSWCPFFKSFNLNGCDGMFVI